MLIDNLPEHRRKEYYIRLQGDEDIKKLDTEFNSGIRPLKQYLNKELAPKKRKLIYKDDTIYTQHGFKNKEDVERYIKKANKMNDKKKKSMLKKIDWYLKPDTELNRVWLHHCPMKRTTR